VKVEIVGVVCEYNTEERNTKPHEAIKRRVRQDGSLFTILKLKEQQPGLNYKIKRDDSVGPNGYHTSRLQFGEEERAPQFYNAEIYLNHPVQSSSICCGYGPQPYDAEVYTTYRTICRLIRSSSEPDRILKKKIPGAACDESGKIGIPEKNVIL
jgi:hypothetical protein